MPAYPATPLPSHIVEEQTQWPAVTMHVEGLIRHVRPLFGHSLRLVTLTYRDLTRTQFLVIKDFFTARKARNERFDFTHPDPNQSTVTFKARFGANRLSWRQHYEDQNRYDLTVPIEEAP